MKSISWLEYFVAKRRLCILSSPHAYAYYMLPSNCILLVGYLTKSSNPMYIGLSGCGGDSGYFVGFMDDVRKKNVIIDTIIIVVNLILLQ